MRFASSASDSTLISATAYDCDHRSVPWSRMNRSGAASEGEQPAVDYLAAMSEQEVKAHRGDPHAMLAAVAFWRETVAELVWRQAAGGTDDRSLDLADPNGHKVHIALEELGLPYKVIPINIGKGDQFKPNSWRSRRTTASRRSSIPTARAASR